MLSNPKQLSKFQQLLVTGQWILQAYTAFWEPGSDHYPMNTACLDIPNLRPENGTSEGSKRDEASTAIASTYMRSIQIDRRTDRQIDGRTGSLTHTQAHIHAHTPVCIWITYPYVYTYIYICKYYVYIYIYTDIFTDVYMHITAYFMYTYECMYACM